MNRRSRTRIVALLMAGLLVLPVVVGAFAATSGDGGGGTDPSGDTLDLADLEPPPQASDLPPVSLGDLPVEAVETLQLVVQGRPFPYDRDGVTFQNREGLLPEHPEGYYREYTVPTPGESDRGARRLVVGGELEVAYYTDDHYESFRELVIG